MSNDKEPPSPLAAFRPNPAKVQGTVRSQACDSINIAWSAHARERMAERDVVDLMVVEVLRGGIIKGSIDPGSNPGEWKLKFVKQIKGRRDLGVVIILTRQRRLLIKTVEWEDVR